MARGRTHSRYPLPHSHTTNKIGPIPTTPYPFPISHITNKVGPTYIPQPVAISIFFFSQLSFLRKYLIKLRNALEEEA